MYKSMSKMLLFVGMKNDLRTFFIRKRHVSWNKILVNVNSLHWFGVFIPQENSRFLNSLISFPKIIFVLLLSFPLIKNTFHRLLFHLSYIDPSTKIFGVWSFSKARILQQFFMLLFDINRIKRTLLLYSSFIAVY